jgi:hypothetical protein
MAFAMSSAKSVLSASALPVAAQASAAATSAVPRIQRIENSAAANERRIAKLYEILKVSGERLRSASESMSDQGEKQ